MKKLSILAIISSMLNLLILLGLLGPNVGSLEALIVFGNGLLLIAFSFVSLRFLNVNNLSSIIVEEKQHVVMNTSSNENNSFSNDKIIDDEKIHQLEKLGELKLKGLISEGEFQEQKKKIIG